MCMMRNAFRAMRGQALRVATSVPPCNIHANKQGPCHGAVQHHPRVMAMHACGALCAVRSSNRADALAHIMHDPCRFLSLADKSVPFPTPDVTVWKAGMELAGQRRARSSAGARTGAHNAQAPPAARASAARQLETPTWHGDWMLLGQTLSPSGRFKEASQGGSGPNVKAASEKPSDPRWSVHSDVVTTTVWPAVASTP